MFGLPLVFPVEVEDPALVKFKSVQFKLLPFKSVVPIWCSSCFPVSVPLVSVSLKLVQRSLVPISASVPFSGFNKL